MKKKIEKEFQKLCRLEKRKGIIGFASLDKVKLLPVQRSYLERKLAPFELSRPITAVSIGVFYTPEEIKSIPNCWVAKGTKSGNWNTYARVCGEINHILNRISQDLAEKFSGIREQATVEGYTHKVRKVEEYYDLCLSHRAFAEEAGLGWRGKSGLIISPENGPALRLSTIFIPYEIKSAKRNFQGCGDCQVCLQVCPFLRGKKNYRQGCLMRLKNIGLENEVCGICIRVCWEKLKKSKTGDVRSKTKKIMHDKYGRSDTPVCFADLGVGAGPRACHSCPSGPLTRRTRARVRKVFKKQFFNLIDF